MAVTLRSHPSHSLGAFAQVCVSPLGRMGLSVMCGGRSWEGGLTVSLVLLASAHLVILRDLASITSALGCFYSLLPD